MPARPATTEQMLQNMFIGSPPGNYDRILDFSRAVTGSLFFVPSQTLLDQIDQIDQRGQIGAAGSAPPSQTGQDQPARPAGTGALNIGSLRGDASSMNNLHRELAPVSDEAWAEIEQETTRTLKRYLAGRRVVDVHGPHGESVSAVGTGHLRHDRPACRRRAGQAARGAAAGRAEGAVHAEPGADRRRAARR